MSKWHYYKFVSFACVILLALMIYIIYLSGTESPPPIINLDNWTLSPKCRSSFKKLVNKSVSLQSDNSLLGLNIKCIRELTGRHLVAVNSPRAVKNYGETSLRLFNQKHCFKRSLTESEKRLHFRARLMEMQKMLKNQNIPFFMDSGTLIGSLRHLGFVPWDDDIDIFVELRLRDKLILFLQSVHNKNPEKWEFSFTNQLDLHIKMRVQRPYYKHTEDKRFRFCFDFFFYELDKVRRKVIIKDLGGRKQKIDEAVIFPTVLRPFETLWWPAPRKSIEFLRIRYYGSWSTGRSYYKKPEVLAKCFYTTWSNFKSLKQCKKKTVSCSTMKNTYAFVERYQMATGRSPSVLELLIIKNTILRIAFLPDAAAT